MTDFRFSGRRKTNGPSIHALACHTVRHDTTHHESGLSFNPDRTHSVSVEIIRD